MSLSQEYESISGSSTFQNSIPEQGSPIRKLIFQWENRCEGIEGNDDRKIKFKLEPLCRHVDRRMSESSWIGSQSSDADFEEYESWPPVFCRFNTQPGAKLETPFWHETVSAMTLEAYKQETTPGLVREPLLKVDSINPVSNPCETHKNSNSKPDAPLVSEEPEMLYPEWLQHGFAVVWEYLTLSPQ